MKCPNCESEDIEIIGPLEPVRIRPDGAAYYKFKCRECACTWSE